MYHGLPSFDREKLKGMRALAPKLLWQAANKDEWKLRYNRRLAEWEQREYLHGELSSIRPGVSLVKEQKNGS